MSLFINAEYSEAYELNCGAAGSCYPLPKVSGQVLVRGSSERK